MNPKKIKSLDTSIKIFILSTICFHIENAKAGHGKIE